MQYDLKFDVSTGLTELRGSASEKPNGLDLKMGELLDYAWPVLRDPYTYAQLGSNLLDRGARFWLARSVVTGDDNTFIMNCAEMAAFTALSVATNEIVTSPVHAVQYFRRHGTLKGFAERRVDVERQHYKVRAWASAGSAAIAVVLETIAGVPREVTTQVSGALPGWFQAKKTTEIRQSIDAGEALNSRVDRILDAPFRLAGTGISAIGSAYTAAKDGIEASLAPLGRQTQRVAAAAYSVTIGLYLMS